MNKVTIFNSNITKDIETAIKSLVSGRTPQSEIREREIRGGETAKYVNTYYMTRQASLLTGWRWSSECLKESFYPSEEIPTEVGALMQVTLFDQEGHAFSHQSWGGADIKRYKYANIEKKRKAGDIISIFDDRKAAYSDGIKKCLSYFGIANDVYGGRDLNPFEDNENRETSEAEVVVSDMATLRSAFDDYVRKHHVRYDIVLSLLNVQTLNEVIDFTAAYKTVKEFVEGGKKTA